MKKLVIFLTLMSVGLLAKSINLSIAEPLPKRVVPNNMQEIFSFSPSVKDAVKSVVNISTTQHSRSNKRIDALMNDPYFRYFFGQQNRGFAPQERAQRALGSGVILSSDGYIVTNSHVIDNADEIMVTLPHNQKEYKAKLIGQDKESDLAVIKIDAQGLLPIKMADSSTLEVGDVVFAVGNPFGVGETVTQGIVSALNKNRVGINQYENFIQTDASINPGNSGGALVDSRGVLIGINSAILSRSGGSSGIGFAIPSNMVHNVVQNLVSDGRVVRGFIGVTISDMNKQLQSVYTKQQGAVVVNVEKDGPAYSYGLKRGDLVYKIESKEIKNASDLKHVIASYKPERRISVYIERDKKEKMLKIVLGSREKTGASLNKGEVYEGLKFSMLTRANRERYRISSLVRGVLIEDVQPNSNAEKVGFQSGDVIIQVENKNIKNLSELIASLQAYDGRSKRVYVNRYGMILMFVID